MKVLFLFTKNFPYKPHETYLIDETFHLSDKFDKIILVPCENFTKKKNIDYRIPANAEVFDINDPNLKKENTFSYYTFLKIFFWQFINSHSKTYFLKHLRTNFGILKHQFTTSARLYFELKKYKKDTVYLYAYWIHHSSLLLGILKERGIIQDFISRGHSLDLYNDKWVCGNEVKLIPFHEYHLKTSSLLSSISKKGESFLNQEYPEYKRKTVTFYLGVNEQGLNPFTEDHPFTIVTCGILNTNKGMHRMVEILALLNFPVKWVHFGSGGDQEENIKNLVQKLPSNIITELMGYTPNEEIRDFYEKNCANLFMNLSEAEGIPVAIMEAISFGIPVMATAVYGNPEIANENTGFSIPMNFDSKETAALIEKFASDKELQLRKREGAKKYFKQYFNAETNFPEFINEILKYPNVIN